MHNSNINYFLDILKDNDLAINLLMNFITNQTNQDHENINIDNLLIHVKTIFNQNLEQSNHTPTTDEDENKQMRKALQFSALENAIQELTANLDLATSSSLNRHSQPQPATYLPFSSRNENLRVNSSRRNSSNSTNENSNLITQLAVNVNSFRTEIQQNLTKIYIDPKDKGKVYMLVSDNAAIFKIPLENGRFLELDECWCDEGLSRDNKYNIRSTMEGEIVKAITSKLNIDLDKHIKIINLGSDKVGLLIILANLNLLGFKNIQVINLELPDIKNYQDYQKEEQDFTKFLTKVFGGFYTYQNILDESNNLVNTIKGSHDAALTVIFAEDLGGVNEPDYLKKYNKILAEVVIKLLNEVALKTGKIVWSEHSGNIVDLNQRTLMSNSSKIKK